MKQQIPMDALFRADESTVSRIAALCPVDWDEDRGFEQSYQNYQGKAVSPLPRAHRRDLLRPIVTAACLLVALGSLGSLYVYRQAAPDSQSTLEHSMPPETQASSRQLQTETTVRTTAYQECAPMPVVTGTGTVPSAYPDPTETAVTTVQTSDVPAENAYPELTELPVQETTELPAEHTEVSEMTEETAASDADETQTEIVLPESGFVVESGDTFSCIRYVPPASDTPEGLGYELELDDLTMEETPVEGTYRRFLIHRNDGSEQYTLDHFSYEEFSFRYMEQLNEVQEITVNGRGGYLVTTVSDTGGISVLFWDDGTGISLTSAEASRNSTLLDIAEHFIAN